jgi:hypothetical protein
MLKVKNMDLCDYITVSFSRSKILFMMSMCLIFQLVIEIHTLIKKQWIKSSVNVCVNVWINVHNSLCIWFYFFYIFFSNKYNVCKQNWNKKCIFIEKKTLKSKNNML